MYNLSHPLEESSFPESYCKITASMDCVMSPNSSCGANGHITSLGASNSDSNGDDTVLALSEIDEIT